MFLLTRREWTRFFMYVVYFDVEFEFFFGEFGVAVGC